MTYIALEVRLAGGRNCVQIPVIKDDKLVIRKKALEIANLVAENTREGEVLIRLMDKLDRMKVALGHEQVYDVIAGVLESGQVRLLSASLTPVTLPTASNMVVVRLLRASMVTICRFSAAVAGLGAFGS